MRTPQPQAAGLLLIQQEAASAAAGAGARTGLSQGARRPSAVGVAGGGLGRRSRLRVAGARARHGGGRQRTGDGDGEMPATWRACRARPSRCIARDSDMGTAVTWARAAGGSLRWRCAWLPFIARLCEHGVRDGQSGPEGWGRWHGYGLWPQQRRSPA